MIIAEIKLWPGGNSHREKYLGHVYIINDGTGDDTFGNYDVRREVLGNPSMTRLCRIEKFNRALGSDRLLALAFSILNPLPTPDIGVELKCEVCALNKPWAIFNRTTGTAICKDCRECGGAPGFREL